MMNFLPFLTMKFSGAFSEISKHVVLLFRLFYIVMGIVENFITKLFSIYTQNLHNSFIIVVKWEWQRCRKSMARCQRQGGRSLGESNLSEHKLLARMAILLRHIEAFAPRERRIKVAAESILAFSALTMRLFGFQLVRLLKPGAIFVVRLALGAKRLRHSEPVFPDHLLGD